MAHREEIGSANIPAITAERSVSEKKLLMFMARFYSCLGKTTEIFCCYLHTRRSIPAALFRRNSIKTHRTQPPDQIAPAASAWQTCSPAGWKSPWFLWLHSFHSQAAYAERYWPTPTNSGDHPNVGFEGVERKCR
jgi:hypothetical protein